MLVQTFGVKRCILGNMKMVNTYSRKMGGRPIWAQLRLTLTPTRDHELFNTTFTETSVKIFRQMVLLFFFFAPKTGMVLNCTICDLKINRFCLRVREGDHVCHAVI